MKVLKPKGLRKGDKVAIVSPSYADAKTMPNRLKQSLVFLKSLGLEPILMPHALGQLKKLPYLSALAKDRAKDLNKAFADSSIKAIFCTVGGENCNGMLPYLDYELIQKNPKIFMGFSDVTVLLLAIHQKTGLVTFHGPNLIYSLGAVEKVPDYTFRYFQKILFGGEKIIYVPASSFCDTPFSSDDKIMESEKIAQKGKTWEFIRPGKLEGYLIGGNLESIQHLRGSGFFPDLRDAILFWEEIDESVSSIHQWLTNFRLSGVFDQIKGMIIGKMAEKPVDWDDEEFKMMLLVATEDYNFPILTEVDLGHTRPMLTLPVGIKARINLNGTIELLEEAVV